MTKNVGYSQESKVTMISSTTPSNFTVEPSLSYRMVGVSIIIWIFNFSIMSLVMTLMLAPRSTKAFLAWTPFICMVTIRIPRFEYLRITKFSSIRSYNYPRTWNIWGIYWNLIEKIIFEKGILLKKNFFNHCFVTNVKPTIFWRDNCL